MRCFNCFSLAACCAFLLVVGVLCDRDVLDEGPVWEDESDSTTEEMAGDRSSTEKIERSLDLKSPEDNRSKGNGQSKTLEETLKNMDFGKLFSVTDQQKSSSPATDGDKSKNIQRVAKKLNLGGGGMSNELIKLSDTEYSNITDSDVRWLMRVFQVVSWNPEHIPGSENVSNICKAYVRQYLRELQNGTLWADKSE